MRVGPLHLVFAAVAAAVLPGLGCAGYRPNHAAIRSYYSYDFTAAREALRSDARRNDRDVLLNNVRLGLAAMADGDPVEAEQAFQRSFDLLSTAGLNQDRTTAAVLVHEGVKIWKGEPFEQALAYYWIAALYATLGDWENARAASANALFRLTDFGGDQDPMTLARRAARDPRYLEQGYTAVDTDFALGFLMEAAASDLSGAPGRDEQLDAALDIDGDLAPIAAALRSGDYDTVLLVDYGKGPSKIAYGPDNALARFSPQERPHGLLLVSVDGRLIGSYPAACDVNEMAMDHRWNNLENIRVAKSRIGTALVAGGAAAVLGSGNYSSSSNGSAALALAGMTMMLVGAMLKAGAEADTRHVEFAPQSIYFVPLSLEQMSMLELEVAGDPGSTLVLPEFAPGRPGAPRAVYLRLHGLRGPDPDWLTATVPQYGNDATGVHAGDWPWILGGRDVSTPDRETLAAYQASGFLADLTSADLARLYGAEQIHLGSGAAPESDESFRHILEGGQSLFTPQPDSMGYKRLMYTRHPPYEPRSDLVRDLSPRLGYMYAEIPP